MSENAAKLAALEKRWEELKRLKTLSKKNKLEVMTVANEISLLKLQVAMEGKRG